MRQIKLTRGFVATVDDEDFERISMHKWCVSLNGTTQYATRWTTGNHAIRMHNEIMGRKGVDHRNGDGLDNQKSNLRFATRSQNNSNRRRFKNNTTGTKGVDFSKQWNKFRVRIQVDKKSIFLGYFDSLPEASVAYSEAALKYHGDFVRL